MQIIKLSYFIIKYNMLKWSMLESFFLNNPPIYRSHEKNQKSKTIFIGKYKKQIF